MSQHEMAFETNFTWKNVYASGFCLDCTDTLEHSYTALGK